MLLYLKNRTAHAVFTRLKGPYTRVLMTTLNINVEHVLTLKEYFAQTKIEFCYWFDY
jgi:hypothetical protein